MSFLDPQLINSLCLVLDIAGAALLWFFGLPEPLNLEGRTYLKTGLTDGNVKRKATRFHRLSKCGLGLIVLGFVLQLASNWIEMPK